VGKNERRQEPDSDPVVSHHSVEPIRPPTYASRGPLVVIQEATESWTPTDPTLTSIGHDTFDQPIAQPLMIAFVTIVDDVLGHSPLEVPLAEGNDAIETFVFDGADEALSVSIRIRRPPWRLHNPDAALAQQPLYRFAPLRVPITYQYLFGKSSGWP
jgi:hypothetical protein